MTPRFRNRDFKPEELLPPSQVKLRECRIEPWPDGRRFRVHLELTPFQQNPTLEAVILDSDGMVAGSATIVENAEFRLVFTMHARGSELRNPYQLQISLTYPQLGVVDQRTVDFNLEDQSNAVNNF